MSEENPFLEVPGMDEADAEDFARMAHENYEAFKESMDLSKLTGLAAIGAPPDAVDGVIALGAQFVTQGHLDKGWDVFKGLVELEPLNWQVHMWLGYIKMLKKDWWVALEFLNLARVYAQDEALPRFYLGEVLLQLDNPPTAIEQLRAAVELAKGSPKLAPQVKRAEQLVVAAEERMKVRDGK